MAGLWSVALRAALRAFASLGIDTGELCRRCEIDPALLQDADARIPLQLTGRIWPEGRRMWGRDGLGLHAGCEQRFGVLDAIDYCFATASTIQQGLERIALYYDVVTGGVTQMRAVEDRAACEVRMEFHPGPDFDLRDYGIACLVQRVRWAGVDPLRVDLRGSPVASPSEYEAKLSCPAVFDQPASAVVLRAEDAARPLPTSFPGLREVIDRELTRVLERAAQDGDPLVDVRRAVREALGPEAPSLSDVARRLGVGERTLQRRLSQQQTTFKDIVEDTRRTLAMDHLKRDRLSVGEIAFLLGYSEPSAFSRAFRRWTREWPADFRARVRRDTRRTA